MSESNINTGKQENLWKEKQKANPDGQYEVSPLQNEEKINEIDSRDKGTKDDWIPRHPALIRLTGRHPLNAEPPIELLMKYGFLTPSSLHYVRNHAPVPKLSWKKHIVHVEGLVDHPQQFTMDQLCQFPSLNIAVTIACDGNRRKELNMIKHTRGFDWGSGGVSTAVWKGARLCDVLNDCGVKKEAKYVCFEGSDELHSGIYGTSIPIEVALDPSNDMMLAYEMNNERLPPDHGFPVRVVLPGYVGGRQVKWLSKIILSDKESQNFYHFHDNRVLPSIIDIDNADETNLWKNPDTLLYHLNVNSVITSPAHDDYLNMGDKKGSDKFTIKGYAYSGGGRKVSRIEISLDGGESWILCNREYLENAARHGIQFWVWCHWSVEIAMWQLLRANEIIVRAWDSSLNTQPNEPNWNVLGMMNNCWYRVKLLLDTDCENPPCIAFKHPVQPGTLPGGWMVPPELEPKPPISAPFGSNASALATKRIPMSEVAQHNKEKDCWVVIDRQVFDLTDYMHDHPGAAAPILAYGGRDVTEAFHSIHAHDANYIKERFCIGAVSELSDMHNVKLIPSNMRALNPRKWIDMKLVSKESISPDTRKFHFQIPDKEKKVGLPVGQHVLFGADIDDEFVIRPYSPTKPVTVNEDNGTLEVVIKIYFPNVNPSFPQGGKMTNYLEKLKIGENMRIKGPTGHVLYHGKGHFTINGNPMKVKHISMVAGDLSIALGSPVIVDARAPNP